MHGADALTLDEIDVEDSPRTATGIGEFDRILGGGIVPGSEILVGGEPGIGKSTLLLQVANTLSCGPSFSGARLRGGRMSCATRHAPQAGPLTNGGCEGPLCDQ